MTASLTYRIERRLPIAVVRLAGELSGRTAAAARFGLFESLAAEPAAVIVDLAELTVAGGDDPLAIFASVAAQAARWPGTPVLLCRARPAVAAGLRRQAVDQRPRVYPTLAAALEVALAEPLPRRVHRRLAPTPEAPRVARELLDQTCTDWELPNAVPPAQILCSELVTNAVRHAGTMIDLTVTLRGDQLRMSVRDRVQQPARLRTPGEADDHGRGMLIVDTVATAWGNLPIADGKAVWASLRVPRQPSGPERKSAKADQETPV